MFLKNFNFTFIDVKLITKLIPIKNTQEILKKMMANQLPSHILDWNSTKSIYIHNIDIVNAINDNDFKIIAYYLKCIRSRQNINIDMTSTTIYKLLIERNKLDYLRYLHDLHLTFEKEHVNYALTLEMYDIVKWFISFSVYPDIILCYEKADETNNFCILDITTKIKQFTVNRTILSMAYENNWSNILLWLSKQGFVMTTSEVRQIEQKKRVKHNTILAKRQRIYFQPSLIPTLKNEQHLFPIPEVKNNVEYYPRVLNKQQMNDLFRLHDEDTRRSERRKTDSRRNNLAKLYDMDCDSSTEKVKDNIPVNIITSHNPDCQFLPIKQEKVEDDIRIRDIVSTVVQQEKVEIDKVKKDIASTSLTQEKIEDDKVKRDIVSTVVQQEKVQDNINTTERRKISFITPDIHIINSLSINSTIRNYSDNIFINSLLNIDYRSREFRNIDHIN